MTKIQDQKKSHCLDSISFQSIPNSLGSSKIIILLEEILFCRNVYTQVNSTDVSGVSSKKKWVNWLIHPFIKYFLSICCVPTSQDSLVSRTNMASAPTEPQMNKYKHNCNLKLDSNRNTSGRGFI